MLLVNVDVARSSKVGRYMDLFLVHPPLISSQLQIDRGGAGAPDMKKTMCVLWLYPTSITVEYYLDISPK
jgi:hypothetical protein